MLPINCWEHNKCGKEIGGSGIDERGPCPASTYGEADGFLGGWNGGRACFYVEGTFCHDIIPKNGKEGKPCHSCHFYRKLKKEHGDEISFGHFTSHVRHMIMGSSL